MEEKAKEVDNNCKEDDEYEIGECGEGCGEGERCEKNCETVTEEKCETGYETEVKEECSYSTVMDRKCSLGYSVTYEEQCSPSMSCSLLGLSCRRVARCRQVQCKPRFNLLHQYSVRLGGPSGFLTSSFAPFGRSGCVTHADNQQLAHFQTHSTRTL